MATLRYGDVVTSEGTPEEVTEDLEAKIRERRASLEEDPQSSDDEQTDTKTQED